MTGPGRRPIDAAIVYARRGWPVFPCYSPLGASHTCSCCRADCASPGKHPRIRSGLHAATTDELQIRGWWDRWRNANVAIRTGAASGLVVLDIDPDHGGHESLSELEAHHGPLPPCRTVRTGSGGHHLYFAHPGGIIRNDTGRLLGPGIDIRGDGGYVIAPPSHHPSGTRYAVEAGRTLLPALPTWLAQELKATRPDAPTPVPTPGKPATTSRWAETALTGELDRLARATEGCRNDTLNQVGFRLGQIIATGALGRDGVEHALLRTALGIGLGEHEALRTIHSGLDAGESYPRGPASIRARPQATTIAR